MSHWELVLFFFIVSFVYASVGFGGGSSYLAILALYSLPFQEIRLIALLCNIIVVTGGTIIFIKKRQVNWKKILPVAIVSVPLAFLGARMKISQNTFFIILGCSLLVASILLWVKTNYKKDIIIRQGTNVVRDSALGGGIGFLSGMVGIGGGIFLSPLLNLLNWDTPKKIAATASFFILVNSISGIIGQLSRVHEQINSTRVLILCISVLIGGQIGSRIGTVKFDPLIIRRVTAALVFFAGMEVLVRHI
jgi:uncharacterized membrane protein YfcA